MTLQTRKITNQIILVSASSQTALGDTFLRFQEHYESPEFRGKVFTEGQFRAWYSVQYGADTYSSDWTGFNIPSFVLEPFYQGHFDPLTDAEKEMLALFRYRRDKFYVIGAQPDTAGVLAHEISHGLFYTNDVYRKEILKVLAQHRADLKLAYKFVADKGYHPAVFDDEVHAWVQVNSEDLAADYGIAVPQAIVKKLVEIKNKYSKSEK